MNNLKERTIVKLWLTKDLIASLTPVRNAETDVNKRARLSYVIEVLEYGQQSGRFLIVLPVTLSAELAGSVAPTTALERHLGIPGRIADSVAWDELRRQFDARHASSLNPALFDVTDDEMASAIAGSGAPDGDLEHDLVRAV